MRLIRLGGLLVLAALLMLGSGLPIHAQPATVFSLHLYHTNDQHAHHLPDADDNGGAARLLTIMQEARASQPNLLLLDAGDRFSGTFFHVYYEGQDNAQVMNLLGYDAMALGNHEFDNSSAVLAAFIQAVDFPVLAANVDASADPHLARLVLPHTVLTVDEQSIGIIGLVTPRTAVIARPAETVHFRDDLAAVVQTQVAELTAQGVDKIILLTHLGYQTDLDLAANITGVDVIVGGHSHTVPRTYPQQVTADDGQPVLIVQAGEHGQYVGQLQIDFDSAGHILASDGQLIELDASIDEAPEMVALLETLAQPLAEYTAQVVGQTTFTYRRDCYGRECDLGALVTDAMREATGAQIAIQNSGGLRDALPQGDVTYGDVLSVLPFGNQMAVMQLRGSTLRTVLEHGVSGQVDGKFPQVSGLRYVWNPSVPDGERIVTVEVWDEAQENWQPLDDTVLYQVVTNDFMRSGGDGYQLLVAEAIDPYDSAGNLAQTVADYIARHSPVSNRAEGRIRIGR